MSKTTCKAFEGLLTICREPESLDQKRTATVAPIPLSSEGSDFFVIFLSVILVVILVRGYSGVGVTSGSLVRGYSGVWSGVTPGSGLLQSHGEGDFRQW
jgi:hypothetical protein